MIYTWAEPLFRLENCQIFLQISISFPLLTTAWPIPWIALFIIYSFMDYMSGEATVNLRVILLQLMAFHSQALFVTFARNAYIICDSSWESHGPPREEQSSSHQKLDVYTV